MTTLHHYDGLSRLAIYSVEKRTCPDCGYEFPATDEFFSPDCHFQGCLDIRCKACRWDKRKGAMKRRRMQRAMRAVVR